MYIIIFVVRGENMEEEQVYESEIDLLQIIQLLIRKWWVIVLSTVIVLIITIIYSFGFVDDQYTAQSSMIVQVVNENQTDYNNLVYGQRLVDTYQEIAQSNIVLNQLREDLDIELSNSTLRNMITLSGVQDTAILKLQVEYTDPVFARDVANEIVLILQTVTQDFEGLEQVELIDVAETPMNPSGPNRMLYMAIGVILGGMIGVAIVFAVEFLDKKLRYPKDIEEKLGLRLLGTIPFYDIEKGDEN
jgi:capsular polysaccharide biosynthesis protein